MQIWPAIDLRDGKCVRLRQGDYNQETIFGDNPAAMARRWVEQGAQCLHLVDLDGARDGATANRQAIEAILSAVDVPCELGGGIRDEAAIGQLLGLGLAQLVVGTRALKEPDWFRQMCRRFSQSSGSRHRRPRRTSCHRWLAGNEQDRRSRSGVAV